jgi:hypothetical protein
MEEFLERRIFQLHSYGTCTFTIYPMLLHMLLTIIVGHIQWKYHEAYRAFIIRIKYVSDASFRITAIARWSIMSVWR